MAELVDIAPDLLTIPQAARRLGISPDTLYRWCRAGTFEPAIRLGSHYRVSVPRLDRYLHGEASS